MYSNDEVLRTACFETCGLGPVKETGMVVNYHGLVKEMK